MLADEGHLVPELGTPETSGLRDVFPAFPTQADGGAPALLLRAHMFELCR
jgi:hypothetical protein